MRDVRLWVYDDCMASAVAGSLDVFATANAIWQHQQGDDVGPLLRCRVEALGGKPITTSSGVIFPVDGPIDPRARPDAVFLPGLWCARGFPSLAGRLTELRPLFPLLRRVHERGALLAANCSATFLLAEAELLRGTVTTTWWLAPAFRERYPRLNLDPQRLLTEHGRVLCSGATNAYLELALRVVERLGGRALAARCARLLLIDADRASQAAHMTASLQEQAQHADALVQRAQSVIQSQARRLFSLAELAQKLRTSERTLLRRFSAALGMSPIRYAQRVRIETAKALLETSSLELQQICERVGYTDIGTFRRLFKREAGILPAEYRRRYGRVSRRSAGR
ncbi:MAG: helix-turn-helix domain-containing protein [Polyangiales bacterium]